jgi:hypothetical protein
MDLIAIARAPLRPVMERLPRVKQAEGLSMAAMVSTISPDNPSQSIKTLLAIIVEHAGGDFVGIQDALPEHGLPAYVLFNHPKHRSTLALRLDEHFSTEAILKRLAECDKRFSEHSSSR